MLCVAAIRVQCSLVIQELQFEATNSTANVLLYGFFFADEWHRNMKRKEEMVVYLKKSIAKIM